MEAGTGADAKECSSGRSVIAKCGYGRGGKADCVLGGGGDDDGGAEEDGG